jgi:hypothetical protein
MATHYDETRRVENRMLIRGRHCTNLRDRTLLRQTTSLLEERGGVSEFRADREEGSHERTQMKPLDRLKASFLRCETGGVVGRWRRCRPSGDPQQPISESGAMEPDHEREGSFRECPRCRELTLRYSTRTQIWSESTQRPGWLCVNPICRHVVFSPAPTVVTPASPIR